MALTQPRIAEALRALGLEGREVLVHSSLSSLHSVAGGAGSGVTGGPETVLRALADVCATVLLPAFTYECAAWDERGRRPANAYPDRPRDHHPHVTFSRDTPVSREIGMIPDTLRRWPQAERSAHPLQSFLAFGPTARELVVPDDRGYPLGPIRRLLDRGGWLLLLGVSHTSSTAIHLAEHLEGRAPFIRHARTPGGVVEVETCGCSDAFDDLDPSVEPIERAVSLGAARHRAYPLGPYVDAARRMIRRDPNALLCGQCPRCRARWHPQV